MYTCMLYVTFPNIYIYIYIYIYTTVTLKLYVGQVSVHIIPVDNTR